MKSYLTISIFDYCQTKLINGLILDSQSIFVPQSNKGDYSANSSTKSRFCVMNERKLS